MVKIERATSMLDLRKLLPRAVFETCFSGESMLFLKCYKALLYRSYVFKGCNSWIYWTYHWWVCRLCCLSVFLDGLYCSLCELVSSEADETSSLSSLLWEIKEKDVVRLYYQPISNCMANGVFTQKINQRDCGCLLPQKLLGHQVSSRAHQHSVATHSSLVFTQSSTHNTFFTQSLIFLTCRNDAVVWHK